MTRDEMLSRISSMEITEWIAYERIAGPLGAWRFDVLTAHIVAAITNGFRAFGKQSPIRELKKFLPTWDRKAQSEQTPDEMLEVIRSLNRAAGGKEVRRNGSN